MKGPYLRENEADRNGRDADEPEEPIEHDSDGGQAMGHFNTEFVFISTCLPNFQNVEILCCENEIR